MDSFDCRRWCYHYRRRCWSDERSCCTNYCRGSRTSKLFPWTSFLGDRFNKTSLSSFGTNLVRYTIISICPNPAVYRSLLSDCCNLFGIKKKYLLYMFIVWIQFKLSCLQLISLFFFQMLSLINILLFSYISSSLAKVTYCKITLFLHFDSYFFRLVNLENTYGPYCNPNNKFTPDAGIVRYAGFVETCICSLMNISSL